MGYKDDELVYDINEGGFIAPRSNESDIERQQREYMERERFNELGLQIIPVTESPKKNPVPPPVIDGNYRPSVPKNKPTYH